MTLSKLVTQNILNLPSVFGAGFGYKERDSSTGLDKNEHVGSGTKISHVVDTLSSYIDDITNLGGGRSPYYVIGEILNEAKSESSSWWENAAATANKLTSQYVSNSLGNLVRAVSKHMWGTFQDGVIIDGFGDVSGIIDVQFTTNPVLFVSSKISDGRMRTPNRVNMKVYVSNYYNDNGTGTLVDYIESLGVVGSFVKQAVNIYANAGNTRAQQALYNLRRIQETGQPFTIYTPHGVYENMLIQSLRPKTNGSNLDMLECDIVFEEMIMYQPYGSATKAPARTNVLTTENAETSFVEQFSDAFDNNEDTKWYSWLKTRWDTIADVFDFPNSEPVAEGA